ncbi:MAG: hypothetical protein DIU78_013425 [Pseudomonadota bacterium]
MKRLVASGVLALVFASCGQGESQDLDGGDPSGAPQGGSQATSGVGGAGGSGGMAGAASTGQGSTSGGSSATTGGAGSGDALGGMSGEAGTTGGNASGGTSPGGAAMGGGGVAPGTSGGTANGGSSATGGEATSRGGADAGGTAGSPTNGEAGEGGAPSGGAAGSAGSDDGSESECGPVTPVPDAVRERLRLDPFYKKHVDAKGLPVLSSDAPQDEALILACKLLNNMLSKRDDVRQALIKNGARFAIIGKDEGTADIPEYGYRNRPQEDIDYINQRARGLGGIVASCGEENILCLQGDRYYNESICVHEFSHTISMYGVYSAERGFEAALEASFDAAIASGILDRTYRRENLQEYWAEGVQDWYDTNASSNPPNGIHNHVNTRAELADFDPTLYALVESVFPESTDWGDCHVDNR